jgi:hypothetical protein
MGIFSELDYIEWKDKLDEIELQKAYEALVKEFGIDVVSDPQRLFNQMQSKIANIREG